MIARWHAYLGLALSERTIECAEVAVRGESRVVRRWAAFNVPPEMSLVSPVEIGQRLRQFLRENGFSSSRAVIGVPAKWLVAREKEVPPADESQVQAMLRLQAERLAASEGGDLIFDYVGEPDPARAGKVLLVAMLRQQMERITQAVEAANLSLIAITSTSLALASIARGGGHEAPMLVLKPHSAEIVWQHGDIPRMLRHFPVPTFVEGAAVAQFGADLKRAVALAPSNGSGPAAEMLLWDGVGLSTTQVAELSSRLGLRLKPGDSARSLGLAAGLGKASASAGVAAAVPAVSLGLAGAQRHLLPVNFVRSRLAPRPQRRIGRRAAWSIGIGAALVGTIVAIQVSTRSRQADLDLSTARYASMKNDIKAAEAVVDRVEYGRVFFEARPPMLDCLREITLAFRDDDRIWVTGFTMRDNRKGQLLGKAADQNVVLAVLDRLKRSRKFGNVTLMDMRDAGGRTKDISFSMSFTYAATEPQ